MAEKAHFGELGLFALDNSPCCMASNEPTSSGGVASATLSRNNRARDLRDLAFKQKRRCSRAICSCMLLHIRRLIARSSKS